VDDPESWLPMLDNAGSIFMGRYVCAWWLSSMWTWCRYVCAWWLSSMWAWCRDAYLLDVMLCIIADQGVMYQEVDRALEPYQVLGRAFLMCSQLPALVPCGSHSSKGCNQSRAARKLDRISLHG
jgi:hypothetical protein